MTEDRTGRQKPPTPEPYLRRLQNRMAKGESLEEAAAHYDMELWRAKAIFVRSGLPVPKPYRRRKPRDAQSVALGNRIHAYLDEHDSARVAELARALGATPAQIRQAIWPQDEPRILRPMTVQQRHSDAAVLIGLQAMSIARGRETNSRGRATVSARYWDAHRDPDAHPSAAMVRLRFGTWRAACEAAGIPMYSSDKLANPRRWSEADCLAAVREFFAGGHGWASSAYTEWAHERDVPSLATVLTHFHSWPELRSRLLAR